MTVWVGEEKVPAQYYRVSYENNDAVGEGTVVVTGLEPYQGTVRRSFAIQFAKPKMASLENSKSGVTVTWKSLPGAAGYLVERKQGDEGWQLVRTVKGGKITRWMDSSSRNGERYGYRVRAYSGDYTSKASTAQSLTYLTAPKLSKLKNTGKRAVTVQWKKNSGASRLSDLLRPDQSVQKGQDGDGSQGKKYENGPQKAAKEEDLLHPHPCLSDRLRQAELFPLVQLSDGHREKVNPLEMDRNPLTKRGEEDIISPKQER